MSVMAGTFWFASPSKGAPLPLHGIPCLIPYVMDYYFAPPHFIHAYPSIHTSYA